MDRQAGEIKQMKEIGHTQTKSVTMLIFKWCGAKTLTYFVYNAKKKISCLPFNRYGDHHLKI